MTPPTPSRARNGTGERPRARKSRLSAGVLLYRREAGALNVFLVHPGGPYWAGRDEGAWSIPKGEFEPGMDPLAAAKREFCEETGSAVPGEPRPLAVVKQPSGKVIHAYALEGDIDAQTVRSNLFAMEWPPRSGAMREFPEVDRGAWFDVATARVKLLPGHLPILDALLKLAGETAGT